MDPFLTDEAPDGRQVRPVADPAHVLATALALLRAVHHLRGGRRGGHPDHDADLRVGRADPRRLRALAQSAARRHRAAFANRNVDQEALSTIWTIVTAPRFLEDAAREAGMAAAAGDSLRRAPAGTAAGRDLQPLAAAPARLKKMVRVRQDGARIYEIAVRSAEPAGGAGQAAQVVLRRVPRGGTADAHGAEGLDAGLPRAPDRRPRRRTSQAAEQQLSAFEGSLLRSTLGGNPINAMNVVAVEVALRNLQEQIATTDRQELQALAAQAQAVSRAVAGAQRVPGRDRRSPPRCSRSPTLEQSPYRRRPTANRGSGERPRPRAAAPEQPAGRQRPAPAAGGGHDGPHAGRPLRPAGHAQPVAGAGRGVRRRPRSATIAISRRGSRRSPRGSPNCNSKSSGAATCCRNSSARSRRRP